MFKDFQVAEAHCDIPCKIYDPAISQVAALSVIRLIDLLTKLMKVIIVLNQLLTDLV